MHTLDQPSVRPTRRRLFPGHCLLALLVAAGSGRAIAQTAPRTTNSAQRYLATFAGSTVDLHPLADLIREVDGTPAGQAIIAAEIQRLQRLANAEQASFAARVRAHGGRILDHYWLIPGCSLELDPAQRAALRSAAPEVQIESDSVRAPLGLESHLAPLPIRDATNGLNHNSDALHARGIRGAGATLAVLDSGQAARMPPPLNRPHRIYYPNGTITRPSRLLANLQVGALPPTAVPGHGTAMTGIAAGGTWLTAQADNGHAPEANIVGMSVADTQQGTAQASTLIRAWQLVVSTRTRFRTRVVLNAYEGSPNPLDPVQRALDAAVLTADVLVVVPAGNTGSTGTANSQSAANGLAVGSVTKDLHIPDRSSSVGPLRGDPGRTYPDLAANGVQIVTPNAASEARNTISSGTCAAAAQIAGAALLYRSLVPTATALQTKAAILACTDPQPSGANVTGEGYPRFDRLVQLANRGFIAHPSLGYDRRRATYYVRLPAGSHDVVLTWHRHELGSRRWTDLDLQVELNGNTFRSQSRRNLYERVRVQTSSGGLAKISIDVVELECPDIPVIVTIPTIRPPDEPQARTFGEGCGGQCPSINPDGDKLIGETDASPVKYAIRVDVPVATSTDGWWMCAQASTNIVAHPGALHQAVGGFGTPPQNTPWLTGTFPMIPDTGIADWHQCQFGSTTVVPPGTYYFVFESVPSLILPSLTAGDPVPFYTWTGSSWAAAGTKFWAFRLQCPTETGEPTVGWDDLPYIGFDYTSTLGFGKPAQPVSLILGGGAAQIKLGPFGAPGCTLNCRPDLLLPALTNQRGSARQRFRIPTSPTLVGAPFFTQWTLLDPRANALGLITTKGVQHRIGGY